MDKERNWYDGLSANAVRSLTLWWGGGVPPKKIVRHLIKTRGFYPGGKRTRNIGLGDKTFNEICGYLKVKPLKVSHNPPTQNQIDWAVMILRLA